MVLLSATMPTLAKSEAWKLPMLVYPFLPPSCSVKWHLKNLTVHSGTEQCSSNLILLHLLLTRIQHSSTCYTILHRKTSVPVQTTNKEEGNTVRRSYQSSDGTCRPTAVNKNAQPLCRVSQLLTTELTAIKPLHDPLQATSTHMRQ